VAEVVIFGKQLGEPLNRRRRVTIELPEFAVRAIQWRVDDANAAGEEGEHVTFNDVVEWTLVTDMTIKRMPLIEKSIPGFGAAMFYWLAEATYQPEED
jgi:hypothetical protein